MSLSERQRSKLSWMFTFFSWPIFCRHLRAWNSTEIYDVSCTGVTHLSNYKRASSFDLRCWRNLSTLVKLYSRNFHIHWNETGQTPCPEPENTPPRNNTERPDGGASAYINENVRHPAFFPSETLVWYCGSPRKRSGAKMAVWRRAAILAAAKPRQCSGSCTGNFWQNGVSIFNRMPYLRGRSL